MSESTNKTVAYWADGFWTSNLKDAETTDQFDGFGEMKHSLLDVPKDAESTEIDQLVGQAIKGSEAVEAVENLEARAEA